MFGEQRLRESGDGLGARHVGPRHESAETPPADLRPGEEDEVGTADALGDAAQIFLDRLAMTREPGARRTRPARDPLSRVGGGRGTRTATTPGPARAARRDDDSVGIRDRSVEQLDLEADDRVESR